MKDVFLDSCLEMSSLVLESWDPDGGKVRGKGRTKSKDKLEALEDFEPSAECDEDDEDDEDDSDEDDKCDPEEDSNCRCTSTRKNRKCCSKSKYVQEKSNKKFPYTYPVYIFANKLFLGSARKTAATTAAAARRRTTGSASTATRTGIIA